MSPGALPYLSARADLDSAASWPQGGFGQVGSKDDFV